MLVVGVNGIVKRGRKEGREGREEGRKGERRGHVDSCFYFVLFWSLGYVCMYVCTLFAQFQQRQIEQKYQTRCWN